MEFIVLLIAIVLIGPYLVGAWAHIRAGGSSATFGLWRLAFEDLRTTAEAQTEEIARLRLDLAALRGEAPLPEPDAPSRGDDGLRPGRAICGCGGYRP